MRITALAYSILIPGILGGLLGTSAPQPPAVVQSSSKVTGDYVEARTASVFAGACHYSGESVTTGKDAILAWKVTAGRWNGVDLSGAVAMAAISSQDNLQNENAARQSEIVVDGSAAQFDAMSGFLEKQSGHELGTIASIRRGQVLFDHTGSTYEVKSNGFAELNVHAMPNDECCKEPSLVWYSPLVALVHRKVGYTISSSYSAGTIGDPWQRSEENTAFYGLFQF